VLEGIRRLSYALVLGDLRTEGGEEKMVKYVRGLRGKIMRETCNFDLFYNLWTVPVGEIKVHAELHGGALSHLDLAGEESMPKTGPCLLIIW